MMGVALVRALEDDWRDVLDEVARRRGWPTSRDVAQLAARVAALSAAYNAPAQAHAIVRDAGPARLGFAFARDVPKGAAAVRELIAAGRLGRTAGNTSVRILDLGSGLGATTWGVLRALEASGARGVIDATWVDADGPALDVALEVVRARAPGELVLRARAARRSVVAVDDLGAFDLVLGAQLISELDVGLAPAERVERHAALVSRWLERNVAEHGALVLVEPALRDRTRHLHRLRDAMAQQPGVTVFAPCLHAAPCPALARESDWCHEDLAVDVPPWLAPVARAAGLRREGLTFSYLVLRKDGARLVDSLPVAAGAGRLRVVSDVLRSKGKREAFLCGEFSAGAGLAPGRARVMRLDRDARQGNAAFEGAPRGEILAVNPAPELERARVGSESVVEVGGAFRDESR